MKPKCHRSGQICFLLLISLLDGTTLAALVNDIGVSARHPLHILVPLPAVEGPAYENPHKLSLPKVRPLLESALTEVYQQRQLLPPKSLTLHFVDSRLSDAHALNAAIDQLVTGQLDCIIGHAFVPGLSAVARVSPFWHTTHSNGIPVLTSVGLGANLDNRREFQLLTRIHSPYKFAVDAVLALFGAKGWTRSAYLFDEQHYESAANPWVLRSECSQLMASLRPRLFQLNGMEHNAYMLNGRHFTHRDARIVRRAHERLHKNLRKASMLSNVIILCADPDTLRQIMSAAHELGMAQSGDYSFINIDVFGHGAGVHSVLSAKNGSATTGAGEVKAKDNDVLFRALTQIVLRHSDHEHNANRFEGNSFATALYNAVLLYASAVNETLAARAHPRDGRVVSARMWNRTFVGYMSDVVRIDANGDRIGEYQQLAESDDWSSAAGRRATMDWPVCGWDHSQCAEPGPGAHLGKVAFGIVLLAAGFVLRTIYDCVQERVGSGKTRKRNTNRKRIALEVGDQITEGQQREKEELE